jgi:hypothetical protein
VLACPTLPSAADTDRPIGLSAVRGVEVAELLRVITTLHLEGLLSDAEYRLTQQRLIARVH